MILARTVILALVLAIGSTAAAESAAPAPENSGNLELRAQTAFNAGRYAEALPMFQTLGERLKDEPDKIGQIEEKIRVCERMIAQAAEGGETPAPTTQRTPHPEPKPGETLEITIQQLGNFEFDAENGGNIPEDVQRLSGTPIRVRGYMIPMDQAQNIMQFAIVADLFACCFGQPPQLQHTIIVNTPKGKAVGYYPDEIVVEGVLTVEEKRDDGYIVSIFQMECTSVKPAAK
jgi:hypothetical protein